MSVAYFGIKMVPCIGLRTLCLKEREALRRDAEPECSFVLKQSLHGATHDGFHLLWMGHDHRAEGIVSKHYAYGNSRHQAFSGIQ
jgi:hypothetical protein